MRRSNTGLGSKERVVQRGRPNEVGILSGHTLKCWSWVRVM